LKGVLITLSEFRMLVANRRYAGAVNLNASLAPGGMTTTDQEVRSTSSRRYMTGSLTPRFTRRSGPFKLMAKSSHAADLENHSWGWGQQMARLLVYCSARCKIGTHTGKYA